MSKDKSSDVSADASADAQARIIYSIIMLVKPKN